MLVVMDDDGAHICQVTVYAMLTSSEVNKAESRKTASICRTLFLMLCPDFMGPNTCALSLYYLKVMLVESVVWAVMLTIPIEQE